MDIKNLKKVCADIIHGVKDKSLRVKIPTKSLKFHVVKTLI
ncbi:hypothetical protein NC652_019780 [Populus alba x Populus x berolinensis]|nr:hypothetical protein NC652_019780 [Populus alba x Populus x berolinensis]